MNAQEVTAAFAHVQKQFNGSPCRECKGRNTVALVVYGGAVVVSCETCGGATRKGRLTSG
ncbi:hypothetical protein ACWGI8_07545 [Streptomyces sp. NPDC054841]